MRPFPCTVPSALIVTLDGFDSDNGLQPMLTQLLPSSTVAAGVKLKRGFGTVASEIPGGTCQAAARSPGVSGDTRDPSQYWLMKFGAAVELPELKTLDPPAVSTESVARSVTPEPWLVG